jgi:hypothetical protein
MFWNLLGFMLNTSESVVRLAKLTSCALLSATHSDRIRDSLHACQYDRYKGVLIALYVWCLWFAAGDESAVYSIQIGF